MTTQIERRDVALAVNRSLSIFGEPAQRALFYHLWKRYDIDILSPDVELSEIEDSIKDIFSKASVLILNRLHAEISSPTLS